MPHTASPTPFSTRAPCPGVCRGEGLGRTPANTRPGLRHSPNPLADTHSQWARWVSFLLSVVCAFLTPLSPSSAHFTVPSYCFANGKHTRDSERPQDCAMCPLELRSPGCPVGPPWQSARLFSGCLKTSPGPLVPEVRGRLDRDSPQMPSLPGLKGCSLQPDRSLLAETPWPGLAPPRKTPSGCSASLSREDVSSWAVTLADSGSQAQGRGDVLIRWGCLKSGGSQRQCEEAKHGHWCSAVGKAPRPQDSSTGASKALLGVEGHRFD